MRRIGIVVNADWFFVSHRLPLGRALVARGDHVTVIAAASDAVDAIRREGMRFLPLAIDRGGTNPAVEAATLASLAAIYRRERFDLVHHVTIKPVLYGSLVARLSGIRRVVNAVSGLGFAFIPRPDESMKLRLLRRGLWGAYRVALRSGDTRVIFQNRDDRATFVDAGIVGAARTRLIVGSGVDLERFAFAPLPDGAPMVLLPARLLWDKGVGEFVDAARQLTADGVRARFVIAGRLDPDNPAGVPRDVVDDWIRSGVVEWRGPVAHAAMAELYRSASLVVLPSYREGMPLALAEAAACGRPCVSTDVPGCREAVVDGQTGWLVPPRDFRALAGAIRAALGDRDELQRRGYAARLHATHNLSLDSVLRQTLAVYDDLFESC